MVRVTPTRRRLLAGLVSAPAAVVALAAGARLGANTAVLRPGGHATSAQRCGQCGGADHTMLAAGCPAAPVVI